MMRFFLYFFQGLHARVSRRIPGEGKDFGVQ